MEVIHCMAKSLFSDSRLAAIYDTLNPWGSCEDFYVSIAGPTPRRILDVGCGTGRLACRLAALGHSVTGVDPSAEMLERARVRPGGTLAFETRNKSMREWERCRPETTQEVLQVQGIGNVEVHNDIRSALEDVVTYETHFNFGTRRVGGTTQ